MEENKTIPLLSVVVPCYHVEEFLENVFCDFMAQTFKDFELIFVNDGSGEKLSSIIKELSCRDSRVIAIDKENGGVSSARNRGIEESRAEWIIFTDPDDRVSPNYLASLYNSVSGTESDLGVGGYTQYYVRENKNVPYYIDIDIKNMPIKEAYSHMPLMQPAWNKIYKRDILNKYNIRFPQDITLSEDRYFNYMYFNRINRVSLIPDCGYSYIMNDTVSALSRYHHNLKYMYKKVSSVQFEFEAKVGAKYIKEKRIVSNVNNSILNLFKIGSPYSFVDIVMYIRSEILADEEWMTVFNERNRSLDTGLNKITHRLIDTHNAWIIAVGIKALFFLKFRLRWMYAKVKSRIN